MVQPSLDTLHRVVRNARRRPGHFVHWKHALEELDRRDDLDCQEEVQLKQLASEIDCMKDSSDDFFKKHSKVPRTTRKPYLSRLLQEELGMPMTERAMMNLRLDRQEEARWLLEVEQARMELQRESNAQIFGGGIGRRQNRGVTITRVSGISGLPNINIQTAEGGSVSIRSNGGINVSMQNAGGISVANPVVRLPQSMTMPGS